MNRYANDDAQYFEFPSGSSALHYGDLKRMINFGKVWGNRISKEIFNKIKILADVHSRNQFDMVKVLSKTESLKKFEDIGKWIIWLFITLNLTKYILCNTIHLGTWRREYSLVRYAWNADFGAYFLKITFPNANDKTTSDARYDKKKFSCKTHF